MVAEQRKGSYVRRLFVLLVIIACLQQPQTADGQEIRLILDPQSGPSGTTVTIRGSGFSPRRGLTLWRHPWIAGAPCRIPAEYPEPTPVATDMYGRFEVTDRPEQQFRDYIGMVYGITDSGYDQMATACFRYTSATERAFPETGFTLSGRFFEFWQENGGLPTYGYPISEAMHEASVDTGQTYLTQWLERNRFELHPENRPPYDVLLGRLGADRLRQLGRDWQAEGREAGPQQGCMWFPETGHNVCSQDIGIGCSVGFAAYWSCYGLDFPGSRYARSLALFGLPLTAAGMETNGSGDTVLTQWFERARFEWHVDPETGNGRVLLGLLGNEVKGH